MSSPLGEWGRRLEAPNLAGVAPLFFSATGELAAKTYEANVMPPEGYAFAHLLGPDDQLLVTHFTVDHDTLHPRPVHDVVKAADWAGRVVLGDRMRFFHDPAEPVMDIVDKDGSAPGRVHLKLLIGDLGTLGAIGFQQLPVSPHNTRVIRPRRLYSAAVASLDLPPLPAHVTERLARQRRTLDRIILEAATPRGRKSE